MQQELAKIDFNEDQKALIKSQIAPKATDDELRLFIYQAQRTGLDPLARQIYAIHRKVKDGEVWKERMTIQTSIDGFRVIAERSGNYAGQDAPVYDYNADNTLKSATINVYKFNSGNRFLAASAIAFWKEYVQTDREGKPAGLWAKMPHTMLAKVAEALALRKAFPQDLSGLYTSDEMDQTTVDVPHTEVNPPAKKPITDKAFNEAIARIEAGEDILDKVRSTYSMSKEQKEKLMQYETVPGQPAN